SIAPMNDSATTAKTRIQSTCHTVDRRSIRGLVRIGVSSAMSLPRLFLPGRRRRGDVVERLVDLADRVTTGTRTGTGLAEHHHHGVPVGVAREPGRGLLPVDLGRPGLGADRHLVQWEALELP